MILECGWGPPHEDVARSADYIVNGSRIVYRRDCNYKGHLYYDKKKKYFRPDEHEGALYFGSAWHDAMDRLFQGESAPEIIADYHLRQWKKPAEQLMFEQGLAAYWHHYGGQPANGKLLASEQDFGMTFDAGGAVFLVLGRYDRLCDWHGALVNGEIKTADPRRKFDVWLTMRSNSIQDAIYNLALPELPRKLPNGVVLPEGAMGTRYDVFFKKNYPARKVVSESAKAKLRGEQEAWTEDRFRVIGITHIEARASKIIDRELRHYSEDLRSRSRNSSSCYSFSVCPFFDHCHKGAPLDGTLFSDRDEDYVDLAEKAAGH